MLYCVYSFIPIKSNLVYKEWVVNIPLLSHLHIIVSAWTGIVLAFKKPSIKQHASNHAFKLSIWRSFIPSVLSHNIRTGADWKQEWNWTAIEQALLQVSVQNFMAWSLPTWIEMSTLPMSYMFLISVQKGERWKKSPMGIFSILNMNYLFQISMILRVLIPLKHASFYAVSA